MKSYINTLLFFLIVSILSSCSFSKGYLKRGDYDNAVNAAAYKLRGNKNRQKEILVLEQAFRAANQRDLDLINQLKREGNPANWQTIYNYYENIRYRQELVKPLLPLFIKKEFREADIKLVNIEQELADAKNKTSEFLYSSAAKLMESKTKVNYREAYNKLYDLNSISGEYKDSKQLLNECLEKGRVYVQIVMTNQAHVILPEDFERELTKINTADLNSQWVQFISSSNTPADFQVNVKLKQVDVTPERINEREYKDKATFQDGWIYSYDKKGNVLKDSAGNDIKAPKMVTVHATVRETQQLKSCLVAGEYEFIDNRSQSRLKTVPFGETVNFENYFATFKGDPRALSKESKSRTGGHFIAFPPDLNMIMDANNLVKQRMTYNIKQNSGIFLQ